MAIAQAGAALQAPVPSQRPAAVLFEPLLADPKEPQFFATYLWTRSPRLASRLGSVGFGQTIGVVRGRDWQVAVAAGGVLEVHIGGPAPQLLHTHHPIGVPRTHRRRR